MGVEKVEKDQSVEVVTFENPPRFEPELLDNYALCNIGMLMSFRKSEVQKADDKIQSLVDDLQIVEIEYRKKSKDLKDRIDTMRTDVENNRRILQDTEERFRRILTDLLAKHKVDPEKYSEYAVDFDPVFMSVRKVFNKTANQ